LVALPIASSVKSPTLAKKAESAAGDSAVSDKVSTVSLTSFEGSPSSSDKVPTVSAFLEESDKTPSVSAFLAAVSAFNLSEICKKNASRFADSIRAAASAA
jgi:hypothetical protein